VALSTKRIVVRIEPGRGGDLGACGRRVEIGDGADGDARRASRLGEKHRRELAAADQADADRVAVQRALAEAIGQSHRRILLPIGWLSLRCPLMRTGNAFLSGVACRSTVTC